MKKNEYDVIIIGAGIGGLVCGCYLAKAGKKVLIVEKNDKVGGLCTSFMKNGFTFNSCIRGIVGCGQNGILYKILHELSLDDKINFLRPEVYDLIKFPKGEVSLHNDFNLTLHELVSLFPDENKALKDFFNLIVKDNIGFEYYKFCHMNFEELLDEYFSDQDLKFFFSILRIDSGLPTSQTSAVADLLLIRGNILDGGYLPKGGMSKLPEILYEFVRRNGGEIRLSSLATKIKLSSGKAIGVVLDNDEFIGSTSVVSNSDAKYTYCALLSDWSSKNQGLYNALNDAPISTSVFITYLGVNNDLQKYLNNQCVAVWNFPKFINKSDYKMSSPLETWNNGLVCALPSIVDNSLKSNDGGNSVVVYFGVPYKSPEFWKENREKMLDTAINKFLELFPVAKSGICYITCASPIDLEKMTLNHNGASRGWAPTLNKVSSGFLKSRTQIENLYLTGHWVSTPFGNGGVGFVAQSGKSVAKMIINSPK